MAELMCQHCGFSNQNAGTTCALCGQPLSQSEEQKAATFVKAADTVVADEDSSAEVDENSGAKKVEAEEDSGAEKAEEVAGWTERELCPDGTCLGVIGPDGRCKICGKSGNGEPR